MSSAPRNFFEEFVAAYANDPVLFVEEMLGAQPFDYQAEFCVLYLMNVR